VGLMSIAVGVVLLFFGRRLFWAFVAAIGFVAGLYLVVNVLHLQPQWLTVVAAVAAGAIGALLAVFLQRLALGIAGFIAGGYFAVSLVNMYELSLTRVDWIAFLIGGIIGSLLVAALFNWALIILSSLNGAMLITQAADISRTYNTILLIFLILVGIAVQVTWMNRSKPEPAKKPEE
jgi:hypothetical protein